MKQWKKTIAAVLMCAMVVSLGGSLSEVSQAAMPTVETVYFEEKFDTAGTLTGWASTNNSNLTACKALVSDGVFCVPSDSAQQYFMYASDVEATDYTVSCDITLGEGEINAEKTLFTTAIASRVTGANTGGYEFQLCIPKDGSSYVRLRDRTGSTNFEPDYIAENVEISTGNKYTVKMETYGNNIKCYLNDVLVLEFTDEAATYSSGSVAIRAVTSEAGIDVTYDNFKIYDVTVNEHKFCEDFNGYNGEAANAEKKQELEANDWYVASNANAEYVNGNSYVIPGDSSAATIVLQTENARGALGWNDYSVEADVTIGPSDTALASAVYACVTGRHTAAGGNDGYEIRLYEATDGTQELQIYARNAGSIIASCAFSFERGKAYNLKAVFQKNEIYAYVDGVLYLTATSDAYPIGYAGIRKIGSECGADVIFDNFVVYDYDVTPPTFKEDFNSYIGNTTGASNKNAMIAKGWNTPNNTQGNYNTGTSYKLPATATIDNLSSWNLKLENLSSASNWKNCTIECDLTFEANADATGTATSVYIACRETAGNTGYGLLIGTNPSGQIRYIRIVHNGSKVGEAGTASNVDLAADKRIACGTTVTAKMELNERTITGCLIGYEDTTTVTYTIPDTEEINTGYAGIHASTETYFDITFDNFIVYDNDNPYVKEIVGDINADTSVNAEDTTALKDNLLSGTLENTALDVNKNNATNIFDYVRIKRLVYSLEH